MHEHQALVGERVAVGIAQIALGGGADVREDEAGRCFRCDARQVDAVPCWDCGREDAGFRAQGGRRVVADSEAVAVVRAASVLEVKMC